MLSGKLRGRLFERTSVPVWSNPKNLIFRGGCVGYRSRGWIIFTQGPSEHLGIPLNITRGIVLAGGPKRSDASLGRLPRAARLHPEVALHRIDAGRGLSHT